MKMLIFSIFAFCLFGYFAAGTLYDSKECKKSKEGFEYMGSVNKTSSGKDCQRWDKQEPHDHPHKDPLMFPDRNWAAVGNKCRNPDAEPEGPWCYTTDSNVRWEYCSVPKCGDCKKTKEGSEYMGSVNTTNSGKDCQRWDKQEPHNHPLKDPLMFPDRNWAAVGNKCRNPDAEPEGPWCYTTDSNVRWEYCPVPKCEAESGRKSKPSASCTTTAKGVEYIGKRGMTRSGRPCQRWDRQFPHKHRYTRTSDFIHETINEAENFCRNPDKSKAPWCYTIDRTKRREYCDIPVCSGCKQQHDGRGYAGTIAITTGGLTCQRWDSQSPHPHSFTDSDSFPDATLSDAANYCRNPNGREGGVWCYTVDSAVEFQYCNVSNCQEDCAKDAKSRRKVKHVLQIGIDGLHHNCWCNAPGGAPDLVQLTKDGAYTYKSRTDMITVSAPGWSSQLCGMDTTLSGCIENVWKAAWMGYPAAITPVTGTNYPLPCVFMYLKGLDANIRTAAFMDWDWLSWLTGRGAPGSADVDVQAHACSDKSSYRRCDAEIANQTAQYLKKVLDSAESSYTFMYLGGADVFGHAHGFCSAKYLSYIDEIDTLVGRVLDAVNNKDVLVLLSSDHGGDSSGHGKRTDSDVLIPLFIKGPGVKAGYEIQRQTQNIDMLPTLVWAMGYDVSPHWNGQVLYEVFND